MRARPRHFVFVLLATLLAVSAPATAVVIDWATIGAPGNACDPWFSACHGDVAYTYEIAKHEVTNAQYAEFLNAVAAADPNALYNPSMGAGLGGITRTGSAGSYSYGAVAGREAMPVNYVDLHDTLRFANWLHNGQPIGMQGVGTTEDGSYTLTPAGIASNSIVRNAGATIVLANEDEWYKAAYYSAVFSGYFDFPTGTNTLPACSTPTSTPNSANCGNVVGNLTPVGAYPGSASPFGTFDQAGNVWEWDETIIQGAYRGIQSGSYGNDADLTAFAGIGVLPTFEEPFLGFRVANIPEPSTAILVAAGLACLAARGRQARKAFPVSHTR